MPWKGVQAPVLSQLKRPDGTYELKSGFKMIARDAPLDIENTGKKQYALVPWSAILSRINIGDCENWYELLADGTFVRLTFDMDGDLDSEGLCRGRPLEEVKQIAWPQVVLHCQRHADRLELNVDFDTVVLDASGNKFSQHLIMRAMDRTTGKEVFFKDMRHAGAFMRTAFVLHRGDFPEWIIRLLDFRIYTRNRVFRFLMAKKKKLGAVRLDLFYPPLGENGVTRASIARHTLVQPAFLPTEPPRLIECRDLDGKEAKSTSKTYDSLLADLESASGSVGDFLVDAGSSDASNADYPTGQGSPKVARSAVSTWRMPGLSRHPRNTIYMISGPANPTVLTGYSFSPNLVSILREFETAHRALPDPTERLVLPGDIDLYRFHFSFDKMQHAQQQAVCLVSAAKKRILRNPDLDFIGRIALGYFSHDILSLKDSLGRLCTQYLYELTGSSHIEFLRYPNPDRTKAPHKLVFASRTHKCAIAGREHHSNHVYFEFRLRDGTLIQKCHSGVCHGMEPVRMTLPGYLVGALFLARQTFVALEFC